MPHPRIFSEEPLATGTTVALSGNAGRHVERVLRLGSGESVLLFDGSGKDFAGQIVATTRGEVTVAVGDSTVNNTVSSRSISLWQAVCRGPRMDSVVQKATELGVAEIQPVYTDRGIVQLDGQRAQKRLRHWREIAISACEQCGRSILPTLGLPLPLPDALDNRPTNTDAIMLDPGGMSGIEQAIGDSAPLILLIGPEGGFTDDERHAAGGAGFRLVRIGDRILRTETAPIVALGIIQYLCGNLK